jgi:GNAT superfamily N-acetyltransferase
VTRTDDQNLEVRKAEPADVVRIADLYSGARVAAVPMMPPALHTNEEDRAWFATQLAKPTHEAWVAERDGQLVGYALLDPVWLEHLFIRPDATGQGIGAVLLDVVKSLRPAGFSLWVFESNTGARRFYARHGLIELERTDGAANEEKAPDVRMAWPGSDPDAFLGDQLGQVDSQLGDLLARRVALTRMMQRLWTAEPNDAELTETATRAMVERAPELGAERVARIADAIVTESTAAVRGTDPG